MTAVFVVVGSSLTHAGPVESAVYRVFEVAIGGVTGLAVLLLVFPARAHILAIEAAARMLDLMAEVLPELLIGFTQTLDETAILRRQDRIDQGFTRLATIAAEAARERMAYLASEPDTGLMLRTLLRLRHDIVMIGRAAVVPLPETLQARLGPPLARTAETAVDYLCGSGTLRGVAGFLAVSNAPCSSTPMAARPCLMMRGAKGSFVLVAAPDRQCAVCWDFLSDAH